MAAGLTTPVAFIIFNRPEQTRKVFATIRAAKPAQLFVIADGPRANVAADRDNCAAARAIVDLVDWPCEVTKRFADTNLGLRRNVSEGLDWVFAQVERAIILEDDCLPDPTFFPFCEELLECYAQDRHVAAISGTNLDPAHNVPPHDESYYFSRFCHIWGWATWRRAWQMCDHEMKEWPALRKSDWLTRKIDNRTSENFWRRHFDDSYAPDHGGLNTWDVPWLFSCWRHEMMSIVPRTNLITNLGFGSNASHTRSTTRAANVPVVPMQFPLRHPHAVEVNAVADRHIQENFFEGITPAQRFYWKLRLPLPISFVRRMRQCFTD
ncbi:MAG: hypothetical protein QOG48_386 [Verrucomicrobiota bacterium]|jgi:hypothetical protein